MEEEIKELRESGAGGWFQTMSLPEGMAVSSSEVIASLNEHLVQVLQVTSLCVLNFSLHLSVAYDII